MKNKGFALLLVGIILLFYFIKSLSTPKKLSNTSYATTKITDAYSVIDELNKVKSFREHFFCFAENQKTIVFDQNRDSKAGIDWLKEYLSSDYSSYTLIIRYKDGTRENFNVASATTKITDAYSVTDELNEKRSFREHFFCFAENQETIVFDQNRLSVAGIGWLKEYLSAPDYSSYTLVIRYKDGTRENFSVK